MNKKSVRKTTRKSVDDLVSTPMLKSQVEAPETEKTGELLNTSQLAARFNLDRAVVRKRLQFVGIAPHIQKAKENIYLVTETLEDALATGEDDPRMAAARLRKLKAEIELKELNLKIKRGEMLHTSEMTGIVTRVFGALHRKVTVQLPKTLARKLHEVDSPQDVERILKAEVGKVFDEVRADNPKYLAKI